MNTHLRDNLRYLKGLDGAVTFSDAVIIADGAGQYLELPSLTTAQRDAIGAPVAGMVIWNSTNSLVEYYTGATWDDIGERDHGSLDGLGDDDHAQYHNDARHDARNANTHADIASAGADIDDAVAKKHTQNTDTQLGSMAADINMNSHQVTNLAAPAANEALRKGQTDVTDAEVAAANKDGVAGTASMRTLGTGAQQAAAGNHTHTLGDDTSGEAVEDDTTDTSGGYYEETVIATVSEYDLASVTPTFDAGESRAYGVAFAHGIADVSIKCYLYLYMGGVLVGTSGAYSSSNDLQYIAKGARSLSGAQICKATWYNDHTGNLTMKRCASANAKLVNGGVAVGSINF
jgi:hypothetical protein